jgi:hypothetical protein
MAGVAAVLSVGLLVPTTAAIASPGHGHGHGGNSGNSAPADNTARKALRDAIKGANDTYRTAVRAARDAFRNDPNVVTAMATRESILSTSTDPAAIDAAKLAFAGAIVGPAATRDAAIATALGVWEQTVDAALGAYDLATNPTDAAALGLLRTAIRAANVQYRSDIKGANDTYRSAISHAASVRRAAVNTAIATWNASAKDAAAADAFHAAIVAAQTAFEADQSVIDARATKAAAITAAKTARSTAVDAARAAFLATTGHEAPRHLRPILPRH